MAAHILITEPIVESVIESLRNNFTIDVGSRGDFTTEEDLLRVIEKYDALLPMLSTPVTARVIEAGTNLKIIANHAVGYNNINIKAAQKAGVHVANTPGVLSESCADFTMGLMLSVARHLGRAEKYLREGNFNGWEPLGFLGTELNECTLGILGMGCIGRAVARRAQAFGMTIMYHNRHRLDTAQEKKLQANYASTLQKLATQSDILTLHCPLTDDTFHAVDASLIDLMRPQAIIINTARGPVIDEQALAEALLEKKLAGAGLDVFEEEPSIHPKLLDAPNCVLTPHIASATKHTRRAIGELAAKAIRDILKGKNPATISNLLTK